VAKKAHARRYAHAVFEIAVERQELDKWQSDLEMIAVLGQDTAVVALLENPKLHFDDKAKLLAGVLGDVSPLALNLVYLLVARGRLNIVAEIADGYQEMLDAHRGIERADVITAIPLDDEDKLRLEARLGALVDKKVVAKQEVDASLLGGIVARMGGKLLDGSVRSKLAALTKEISSIPR
jgi:F-type H+-transporting ATPase subunit delta